MGKETRDAVTALHEFFPERARALVKALQEMNGQEGALEFWREDQLVKLIMALSLNVFWLERAWLEDQIMPLAWAARNLVELSIWIDYCTQSDANAIRFRDDAARDLLGFSKTIQAFHVDKHGIENPKLQSALQDLATFAQDILGVSNLEEDFRRVSDASNEVGRLGEFRKLNKLFSKFAHPTSLAMNSVNTAEHDKQMREMFFNDGVSTATKALTMVRKFMLKHFPLEEAPATP